MKKTIQIEGMSCGHCAAAVKKELEKLAGVQAVDVNLDAKHAVVETGDAAPSDAQLREAVEEAGYNVTGIA